MQSNTEQKMPPRPRAQARVDVLVVSPHASVSWAEGMIVVSSAESRRTISTDDARVLQVLNAFSTPRALREASAQFEQGFLSATIAALKDIGVLMAVDDLASQRAVPRGGRVRPPAASEPAGRRALVAASYKKTHECVQSVARLVRTIACDVSGLGFYAHRDAAEPPGAESSLSKKLAGVQRRLSRIALEVSGKRKAYLDEQLKRLPRNDGAERLRLHLGCGRARLEGWVNIDLPPAELGMQLGWGLPFDDAAADYVFISHTLEHLYKDEALALLKESRRVLAPSGVVRIIVPDIEKCLRAYAAGDAEFFETRKQFWPYAADFETHLEHFMEYAGAGLKPDNFWGHKYGYDFASLGLMLRQAGFVDVVRSEYMLSAHADLRVDDVSSISGAKCRNSYYSLFVEAAK